MWTARDLNSAEILCAKQTTTPSSPAAHYQKQKLVPRMGFEPIIYAVKVRRLNQPDPRGI